MNSVVGCRAAEIFDDPSSTALFEEYARECANPLIGAPEPHRTMYQSLEWMGAAQCFGAYLDSELVGFAFLLMGPLPHYGQRFATVESLFVQGETRGGLGKSLMKAVEEHAKQNGCAAIFYSAPVGSRLARLLFLCSDEYQNTNHTFTKRLN